MRTELKPFYKQSLEQQIERFRSIDREIKKLQKIADEIKKQITKTMDEAPEAYNAAGHLIATYTEQSRAVFNKIEFELHYPGVYDQFSTQSTSKVLRLK